MNIPRTSNDALIKAVSDCHGDPACIALALGNHLQVIVGNSQLSVAELILRFDAYERRDEERISIMTEAVAERIRYGTLLADALRDEATHLAEELAMQTKQDQDAILDRLASIDAHLAALVPSEEIRQHLDRYKAMKEKEELGQSDQTDAA